MTLLLVAAACSQEARDLPSEPGPPERGLSRGLVSELTALGKARGLSGLVGFTIVQQGAHQSLGRIFFSESEAPGTLVDLIEPPNDPEPGFVVTPMLSIPATPDAVLDHGWGCFIGDVFIGGYPASITSFQWETVPYTGGHILNAESGKGHREAGRPRGSWSNPGDQVVPDGRYISHFTPTIVSGDESFSYRIEILDGPCAGAAADPADTYAIRVLGLVQLLEIDGLDVSFETLSSNHSSVFWVTPAVEALVYRTQELFKAATGDNVTVTAAALPWGGINDVKFNWMPSHFEHRAGNEVDMVSPLVGKGKNKKPRKDSLNDLMTAALAAGFSSCIIEDLNNPNRHVHCRGPATWLGEPY